MRILIFEYISGGGFCATDLPAALAREGELMLKALLADFAPLPAYEVVLMLDVRCVPEFACNNINLIIVTPTDDLLAVFDRALQDCDAAWIIAPETDHILYSFTQRVEQANKLLLSNPSSAVAKTADKLQTFKLLTAHNISTIPTQRLLNLPGFKSLEGLAEFPLVIKPIDGVGGENSFLIQNQCELDFAREQIAQPQHYIIQPFIEGEALSISALFKQGTAQLICVNRQIIALKKQRFHLTGCEVNIAVEHTAFQTLLNEIAPAFADLFGYVGIDLIVSNAMPNKIYVVEINPRLTSSYAGIKQALGINVADLVLQSMNEAVLIKPLRNQTIFVDIAVDIAQETMNDI